MRKRKVGVSSILAGAALGAVSALHAQVASAATLTEWSSTAASSVWADGTNWVGGNAPADSLTGNIAFFNSTTWTSQPTTGVTSIAGIQVGDGIVATGNVAITSGNGPQLTIGGDGILINANAGALTFGSNGVKLGASQSWTNNSSNLMGGSANQFVITNSGNTTPVTLTFSGSGSGGFLIGGAISDGGTVGTVGIVVDMVSNAGVSITSGSFSGGLNVVQGAIYTTSTLGSGAINLGDTTGGNTHNALIGLSGSTLTNDITVRAGSSGVLTLAMANTAGAPATAAFSGNITLNNNVTFLNNRNSGTRTLTMSGIISGNKTVTVAGVNATNGASQVFITNDNGTTFTGNTVLDTVTLIFSNNSLGNAVSGQGNGTITFISPAVLKWAAGNTQDISNKPISANGTTGTIDLGTGNVTFATANGLTGTGNITKAASAGILTLAVANNIAGTYTSDATGTTLLKNSFALGNATVSVATGGITFDSSVGSHAFSFGGLSGAGNLSINDNGSNAVALTLAGAGTSTYSGVLSGSGSLIVNGGGNFTFSGANSFSGGISVTNSALTLSGANTFNGAIAINSGGLVVATLAAVGGVSGPLGLGVTTVNTGGELRTSSATTFNGANITLAGGTIGGFQASSQIYNGNITVTANSTFINERSAVGGTVTNTYGNLSIGTNQLDVTSTNSFTSGTAGVAFLTTKLTGNTTFNVTNNGNATNTTTLTLGSISDGGVARTITKTGSGTLLLNSAGAGLTTGGTLNFTSGGMLFGNATALGNYSLNIGADTTIDTTGGAQVMTSVNAQTWNGNITYLATNSLTFGTGAISLAADVRINSSGTAVTLTEGGNVTGTGNLTLNTSTGGTFAFTGLVNNTGSVSNIGSGTGTSTFSGGIGSNVSTITENSAGSAPLTISGPITVNSAGTTFNNNNASGTAVLTVSGNISGTGNLTFNNNSSIGTPQTSGGINVTAASVNNTGAIVNSGTGPGTVIISGSLGANVTSVTQNGNSPLTLNGNNTNFKGTINLTSGTLRIASATALGGNGTTTGVGGTLNIAAGTTIDDSSSTGVNVSTVNQQNWNGNFTYGGQNGAVNLGTGNVSINVSNFQITNGGTSSLTVGGNITGTSNVTFNNTSTGGFTFTNLSTVGSITNSGGGTGGVVINTGGSSIAGVTHTSGGSFTLNGGNITSGNLQFSGSNGGTVTMGSAVVFSSSGGTILNNGNTSGTSTLSFAIGANVGTITQNSASSTLTLTSSSNSLWTGGLNILQGTVASGVSSANIFGNATNIITLGTDNSNANARLQMSNSVTIAQRINTAANDTGTLTISSGAGNNGVSGVLTLNNSSVQYNFSPTSNAVVSGNITGTGNISVVSSLNAGITTSFSSPSINMLGSFTNAIATGTGSLTASAAFGANVTKIIENSATSTLVLSGNNTAFAGGIEVNAGTLKVNATNSVNVANTVAVASAGTFDILSNSLTVAGLKDLAGTSGTVTNSGASAKVLTLGGNGTYNFGGALTAATPANLALTVALTGNGSQTLGGTATYTGNTTINSGRLIVNGDLSSSANTIVANGALLGGNGTLAAVKTGGTSAVLSPGNSPGNLTMASLDATAGTRFWFQLGATSGVPASDVVSITGTFAANTGSLGNLVLDFSGVGAGPAAGVTYTLITFGSQTNLTSADFSLGASSGFVLDTSFHTTGIFVNTNDVEVRFSAVPEPTSLSFLGLAAGGLLARRRRRVVATAV